MLRKERPSVRWLPKVPHKSNYQPMNPTSRPCTQRRAYIKWCERPSNECPKSANIMYVNEVSECTKFPAYITWAQSPRKCNKLVHIIWKAPPKYAAKCVDVTWADCPETKKRVEICFLNRCQVPAPKAKDIRVTFLTRPDDCSSKRVVLCKAPLDCTPTSLPRTTTIRVYCGR